MKNITKILVAIDFSDYSPQTMKYAAELANELKAALIAVNVINQRDVEAIEQAALTVSDISVKDFLEEQEEERTQEIENLMKETSLEDSNVVSRNFHKRKTDRSDKLSSNQRG